VDYGFNMIDFGDEKALRLVFNQRSRRLRQVEKERDLQMRIAMITGAFNPDDLKLLNNKVGTARRNFTRSANRLILNLCSTSGGFKRFPWNVGRGWKKFLHYGSGCIGISRQISTDNAIDQSTYSIWTEFTLTLKCNDKELVKLVATSSRLGNRIVSLRVLNIELDTSKLVLDEVVSFLCVGVPNSDIPERVEWLLAQQILLDMNA